MSRHARGSLLPVLMLVILAGVLIGFAGALVFVPKGGLRAPVDWSVRFHGGVVYPHSLTSGWGPHRRDGVPLESARAVVTARLPRPASDELLELLVQARSDRPNWPDRSGIAVSVSGRMVGMWRPAASAPTRTQRFIIPAQAVSGRQTIEISFAGKGARGQDGKPDFLLRSLVLRHLASVREYEGFVDNCTPRAVRGWAVADGVSVPVRVLVDGAFVSWVNPTLERKDLAEHGLPTDGGYVHRFSPHLDRGQQISVTFPNGKPLTQSPCDV